MWRRAAEREWRDGSAAENVKVSDEVFVTALERHRDAVDATLATGLLAWAAHIGAAGACRLLIELGADASLRPAMLSRNALHVAASRSWRGAYDAIAAAADDSLALEKDLFGKTPADYWEARPLGKRRRVRHRVCYGVHLPGSSLAPSTAAGPQSSVARLVIGAMRSTRGAPRRWLWSTISSWRRTPSPAGSRASGYARRDRRKLGAFVRRSFGDDVAAAACEGRCGPDTSPISPIMYLTPVTLPTRSFGTHR